MSKRKFFGLVLLVTGLVLLISVGLVTTGSYFGKTKSKSPVDSIPPIISTTKNPMLVINLPASPSLVSSPMLVRGKVYGDYEKVEVQLLNADNQPIVSKTVLVQKSVESGSSLYQVSVVFPPQSGQGQLQVSLLDRDGKIVESETVIVQFKT